MFDLKGSCILAQSGGPTSVINASAAGVFLEAFKQNNITNVYASNHGIKGILDEVIFDISKEDLKEIELLKTTPSSMIGSVRYKLKSYEEDKTDYIKILEVFKKYNIRYFFYNGGNDSMDTINKISKFLQAENYECMCIGIPKTIDNDLFGTDHCPGYGSAAKYIATTIMELYLDSTVYDLESLVIVEVMGRNAGWLTAASELARYKGYGPDLIYFPEIPFNLNDFLNNVKKIIKTKKSGLIVVSEGLKDITGKYIHELYRDIQTDSFGNAQLGGCAQVLSNIVKKELGIKTRFIELSLLQRCAQHLASKTDIDEAYNSGIMAVKYACSGITDKMVVLKRDNSKEYKIIYDLLPLEYCANTEKKLPLEWINKDQTSLSIEFINYLLPLIQGDMKAPLEDGLPRFAKLKKVLVKK